MKWPNNSNKNNIIDEDKNIRQCQIISSIKSLFNNFLRKAEE